MHLIYLLLFDMIYFICQKLLKVFNLVNVSKKQTQFLRERERRKGCIYVSIYVRPCTFLATNVLCFFVNFLLVVRICIYRNFFLDGINYLQFHLVLYRICNGFHRVLYKYFFYWFRLQYKNTMGLNKFNFLFIYFVIFKVLYKILHLEKYQPHTYQ